MNEEYMKKFNRHTGKPEMLKLVNDSGEEDEFPIHPLGFEYLPHFLKIASKFKGMKKEETITEEQKEDFIGKFDEETVKCMKIICEGTVRNMYPDIDDATMGRFIAKNFMELIMKIMEVTDFGTKNTEVHKRIEHIRKIKESANAASSETPAA